MTNNLVHVNPQTGEVMQAPKPGLTANLDGSMPLGMEHIKIPMVKVVQPVTRGVADGHNGELLLTLDDSFHKEFVAVIVGFTNISRAKFGGTSFDRPPQCASDDGYMPRSQAEAEAIGAGPTCDACVFSRFGENGEPPACAEAWNYLGLTDDDDPTPFIFRATGNGIAQAKVYNTPFVLKRKPFFSRRTRITSVRTENERGVFYVPRFATEPFLNEDEAAGFRALAAEFAGFTVRADDTEYEQGRSVEAAGSPLAHHQEVTPEEILAMPEAVATAPAEPVGMFDDTPEYQAFKDKMNAPEAPRRPQRAGAH